MKQEFKVLADKADERVQLLEKKNAQLQEDLERLDAENMLRMKDMMKDEMERIKCWTCRRMRKTPKSR